MTPSETPARWPVAIDLPVQWGDMDAYQHVNNVVYLRWFESARIAYFRAAGVMAQLAIDGRGPILARSTVDYRIAVEFPDDVRVQARVLRFGTTSFEMALRMTSRAHGDAPVAESHNVVVMFDYQKKQKTPLWPELRAAIEALEGRKID
jgi:acyl-CoA thioester hydrolase